VNISTGDFHLRDYAKCYLCKKTASWPQVKEDKWTFSCTVHSIFGFLVDGRKRWYCDWCTELYSSRHPYPF